MLRTDLVLVDASTALHTQGYLATPSSVHQDFLAYTELHSAHALNRSPTPTQGSHAIRLQLSHHIP